MEETVKLKISNQYFHHHSDGILKKYEDIKILFDIALDQNISLNKCKRSKQKKSLDGYTAKSLNIELRRLLKKINNIEFEVNQMDGVYYSSGQINGFDFALIDTNQNLVNFRNLCFGKKSLHNGINEWQNYFVKNPLLLDEAKKMNLPDDKKFGSDLAIERTKPIILGEIQFGNWALAYRDFFKVLKANILTDVDVLIYIVSDGDLHSMLSDGIVNFEESKDVIVEFAKVITVPIWLIGLDYEKS